MDLQGKKVLIMGLGLNGGGVEDALFFIKEGAEVTVTDLRDENTLKPSLKRLRGCDIKYTLGGHEEDDFKNKDIIIKNPAVPDDSYFLQIAKKMGASIDTSIGIFFENADTGKLIGITGTKGKSSTSALIYEVLKIKYPDSYLAGNIGTSPIKFLNQAKENYGVLELSSYQVEGMAQKERSPHIAVITNIKEDHLNRYKSYDHYREAKKLIFKYQNVQDRVALNYDDEYLRDAAKEAKSQVLFYSKKDRPKISEEKTQKEGAYVRRGKLYVGDKKIGKLSKLGIEDSHHYIENILAALTVAHVLDIDTKRSITSILDFKGLPGRLEYIETIDNIRTYNDTTATNPFASMRSIEKFSGKNIGLILGGEDKSLSFEELAEKLSNVHAISLLPGSASDKILKAMEDAGISHPKLQKTATLREALWWCYAQKPEVILLSPAAASFNMFKNEFDRGDKFIQEVQKLKDTLSNR